MSERFWLRLGAASGLLALVMGSVGFGLIASSSSFIPVGATPEQVAAVVAAPVPLQTFVGQFFQALATLLVVVFAARLWVTLRRAEGEPGWLSATAFAALLLVVASGIGAQAAEYAIALGAGHGLGPEGAWVLHFMNMAFYLSTWGFNALFLGITAVILLQTYALPRWLGWSALCIAVANLAGLAVPTGDFAQLPPMIFRLWILAASIVLLRQAEEPRPAVRSALT